MLALLCTELPTSKNHSAKELRSREGGWVINTLILVQLPVAMGRQARRHCHTKGHDASTAAGSVPAGPDCNRKGRLSAPPQYGQYPRPCSATACKQLQRLICRQLPRSLCSRETYVKARYTENMGACSSTCLLGAAGAPPSSARQPCRAAVSAAGTAQAVQGPGPRCTWQTQPGRILHRDTGPQGSSYQEDTGGTLLSLPPPPHSLLSQK